MEFHAIAGFLWSVADLLRGDYKQSDYGKVILPFTLLRRLDCVLEPTKAAVLAEYQARKESKLPLDTFLPRKSGQSFYNVSELDFARLLADPNNIRADLIAYVAAFSENARDIFERYEFAAQVERLDNAHLLYLVVQKFAGVDLHPDAVDNHKMGLDLRGADPPLCRAFQRDGRRTLHPARCDPADGHAALCPRPRDFDRGRRGAQSV